ncbi:MAG: C-terminal binding protein [Bacteroidia bacterium]|nr:C-terminal binding protein [Bacteroidia bacterium]
MKIVFTDYYYPDNTLELEVLSKIKDVEIVDLTKINSGGIKESEKLIPYVKDADAIIVQFAQISKELIEQLENCKIIARYAIGVDNIDVEAAKKKGITVSNVPDYCIEEVSDTAVAHILNLNRSIGYSDQLLRGKRWTLEAIRPLKRLQESVIGLVAFGNIAQRTAEKLRPYGCTLLAYDPYFNQTETFSWVKFVSLEELLSESDIVSIHAPLNKNTQHLIGQKELALMKNGSYLVNTSRGGLIEESALYDALKNKKLGGVGLDVLDMYDSDYQNSRLLEFKDNLFITPHLGWYSETSIDELKMKVAENVKSKILTGKAIYEL